LDFEKDLLEMKTAPFEGDTKRCMELEMELACCDTSDEMDREKMGFRQGPCRVGSIDLSVVVVDLEFPW
jgi:hypothetical protein